MFPYESVPDGAIFAPHHYHMGVLATLLVAARVWDDIRDREPLLVAIGTLAGAFGFTLVWPFYPITGAILAIVGPAIATGALARSYWANFPKARIAGFVALLVIWDDVLEHSFGVWTPLDQLWKQVIVNVIA